MDEFLKLIEAHKDEFYRYIYRMSWDSGVVDDVFQSAVLTAYENRERFVRGTNFRAWMFRIITNKCYVANRETSRTGENLDDHEYRLTDASPTPAMEQTMEDPEALLAACGDEVQAAVRALSAGERSCLLLRAMDGFSYKEIATILEMPVGTVMTHLARGRAKLRKRLLTYAREEGIVSTPFRVVDGTRAEQDSGEEKRANR